MIYEKIPTKSRVTLTDVAAWTLALFPFATMLALALFYPESLVGLWGAA